MAAAKPSVPSAASGSQRRPSYRRRLGYDRRSQPTPSTSSTSTTTSSTTSTNTFTRNMAAHTVDARTGSPEEFGGRVHLDQGRTGWSGERDEHEGPEADHEGLHHRLSNTLARWARPSACGSLESYGKDRARFLVQEPEGRGG